jgi:hypothetical protein
LPLTPNFSASQPVGENKVITLEDTSGGSDGAVASRRAYFITSTGDYLVEDGVQTDYNEWDLVDTEKNFEVLDKDRALEVLVEWVNSNGDVLYTKTQYIGFTQFNEEFDYGLTQKMAGNPLLINDSRWFELKSQMRTFIDSGNQAIELASDVVNAQLCYDRATEIRLKQQYLF